jgi:hypothetical protein
MTRKRLTERPLGHGPYGRLTPKDEELLDLAFGAPRKDWEDEDDNPTDLPEGFAST